jgi:hypothetical membrane protein
MMYDAGGMKLRVLAVVGQLVFVGGWLVLGVVEGHGYSAMRHDISDLGALTAHHATAARLTLFVSGALTVGVALALRRRLGNAALLIALSLPGLDGLSDAFFRVDCRAADAGCSMSDATSSWHGKVHIAVFVVAALATVAAPFVLARRLGRPARVFGWIVVALLLVTGASSGTAVQGLTQRITAVVVCAAFVALVFRTEP